MKKELKGTTSSLKKTLSKMKWWAKEKDRRFLEHKKLAEKVFGPLVKKLKLDS